MKDDWILPWEVIRFKRSAEDLRSLQWHLSRDGLRIDGLDVFRDDEGINVTSTIRLLNSFSEHPWIMAMSNSAWLLQAIAALLPITYALTTMGTVRVITTQQLIDNFEARRPGDDFENDPAGEFLHRVVHSRLLVWDNADHPISTRRFGGYIASILIKRLAVKPARLTLFLASALIDERDKEQVLNNKLEKLDQQLEEGLGRSALHLIKQRAYHVNILVPHEKVERKYEAWK